MDNSIQTTSFTSPSSWRYEWWYSVWPRQPGVQEWITTWRFSYQNYQTSTGDYSLWRSCISCKTSIPLHEDIFKEWQTQSINCAQYDRYHHIPWKQQKNGCLQRRKHSWTLSLSRDDRRSNNINHFRSSLSSFWSFIFHQHWYIISPASYCISLHETEEYLQIMWKDWTQGW